VFESAAFFLIPHLRLDRIAMKIPVTAHKKIFPASMHEKDNPQWPIPAASRTAI